MIKKSLAAILADAGRRSTELSAAYRSASKRTVSRTLTGLAASAMEQRRQLGEEIAALHASLGELEVSLELPTFPADLPVEACGDDPVLIFTWFKDMESRDRDLFAALASQPGLDPDLAARLAAWAEQARKRASMASDHLDLLSLA